MHQICAQLRCANFADYCNGCIMPRAWSCHQLIITSLKPFCCRQSAAMTKLLCARSSFLNRTLSAVEKHMKEREFLADHFTIADTITGHAVVMARRFDADFPDWTCQTMPRQKLDLPFNGQRHRMTVWPQNQSVWLSAPETTLAPQLQTFAKGGFTRGSPPQQKLLPVVAEIEKAGGSAQGFTWDARKQETQPKCLPMSRWDWPNRNCISMLVMYIFLFWKQPSGFFASSGKCAYAAFRPGREAAKHGERQKVRSFSLSHRLARGSLGYSAFASENSPAGLAQSMARELAPKNIHVAHLITMRASTPNLCATGYERRNRPRPSAAGHFNESGSIAEAYWNLHINSGWLDPRTGHPSLRRKMVK